MGRTATASRRSHHILALLGDYRAMWLVCSAAVLLSLWPLSRLRKEV